MKSDAIKEGVQNAPHRVLFNSLGLTAEEQRRPLIGIVSSYNEIVPGHMNIDKIVNAVKQGGSRDIYTVGGVFGVEIMVDPDDLDRARELIRGMTGDDSPAPASPRFGRRTVLSLGIAVLLLILLVFLRGLLG